MLKIMLSLLLSFTSVSIVAQNFTNSGVSFGDVDLGNSISSVSGGLSITQSTDVATITSSNSVACPGDNDSYLRRFDLDTDHGITGVFNVSGVDFTTETSTGIAGTQDLIVNLYSINNAALLEVANLTLIGTATLAVADGAATIQNATVSGTLNGATDDLVVEIVANDFTNGTTYFIGSNANGQSAPSYLMSAGCGAAEPTDTAAIGFANMQIIMVVNGNQPVLLPPAVPVPSLGIYGLITLILMLSMFFYRRTKS